MSINIRFTLFGYVGTAVIYVLVNSLVLAFERTLSATLLLGLVVAFYLLNPQPKEPQTGFFCFGGTGGITRLCIFKCTGCASLQSKPDEPDESNSGESINKNKVCAGIDVLLRMIPHLPPQGVAFEHAVLLLLSKRSCGYRFSYKTV